MAMNIENRKTWFMRWTTLAMLSLALFFTNCAKTNLEFAVSQSDLPSTTGPTQLQTIESATILRLSGRNYADQILTQIFGAQGNMPGHYSFQDYFINQQINPFGEGCDMYEAAAYNSGTGSTVFDNTSLLCAWPFNNNGLLETNVPSIVSSGTLREANRIQTCQNVVAVPAAVTMALSQVSGASVNVAPDATTLNGAYELFYRGQPASSDIIDALTDLTQSLPTPVTSTSQWQAVLLTLCLAPDWQIL